VLDFIEPSKQGPSLLPSINVDSVNSAAISTLEIHLDFSDAYSPEVEILT
jgi:hypothetical protein